MRSTSKDGQRPVVSKISQYETPLSLRFISALMPGQSLFVELDNDLWTFDVGFIRRYQVSFVTSFPMYGKNTKVFYNPSNYQTQKREVKYHIKFGEPWMQAYKSYGVHKLEIYYFRLNW